MGRVMLLGLVLSAIFIVAFPPIVWAIHATIGQFWTFWVRFWLGG